MLTSPRRRDLLLLLAAAPLLAADGVSAAAPLQLAISANAHRSFQGPWLELIYREAFRRLQLPIQIVVLPSKRASIMADNGQIDGDLHRGASYGASHPGLRRVAVSHFMVKLAAYGQRADLALPAGWDSFSGSGLRVDYILGSAAAQSELTRRLDPALLATVTDAELGLRKLVFQRSDILVALDLNVDPLLTLPEFQPARIRKLAELEPVPCYPYFQQRHAALLPRLAQVLTQMHQEGLIAVYGQQARRAWLADYLAAHPGSRP